MQQVYTLENKLTINKASLNFICAANKVDKMKRDVDSVNQA